jgi:hypothetical protein
VYVLVRVSQAHSIHLTVRFSVTITGHMIVLSTYCGAGAQHAAEEGAQPPDAHEPHVWAKAGVSNASSPTTASKIRIGRDDMEFSFFQRCLMEQPPAIPATNRLGRLQDPAIRRSAGAYRSIIDRSIAKARQREERLFSQEKV